jgi:hypothetical protein
MVARSLSPGQEQESTRQQLSRDNPAALRYVALRCALLGRNAEAGNLLRRASDAGDEWAGRILDDTALPGVPPLPSTQSQLLAEDTWAELFGAIAPVEEIQLAREPRVALNPGWLPVMACRLLAAAAISELQPSLTYDPASGQQIANPVRTSYSMTFMPWLLDPSVAFIQRRLATHCAMQPYQCEVLGLLRYQPGQVYQLHYDAFAEDQPGADLMLRDGGQRIRTALVYLNDEYVGGETRLEYLDISVKGSTGDLLVFDNVNAQGQRHRDSLHTGKPVQSGTKWLLSQWYREHETAFTRQMDWREADT